MLAVWELTCHLRPMIWCITITHNSILLIWIWCLPPTTTTSNTQQHFAVELSSNKINNSIQTLTSTYMLVWSEIYNEYLYNAMHVQIVHIMLCAAVFVICHAAFLRRFFLVARNLDLNKQSLFFFQMNLNNLKILVGVLKWIQTIEILLGVNDSEIDVESRNFCWERTHYSHHLSAWRSKMSTRIVLSILLSCSFSERQARIDDSVLLCLSSATTTTITIFMLHGVCICRIAWALGSKVSWIAAPSVTMSSAFMETYLSSGQRQRHLAAL